MAATLELRLQEAASYGLSHPQFLELLFQDELKVRQQRSPERRKRLGRFPDLQPLEAFDWQVQPPINRAQIDQLAIAQFVRERRDALVPGPRGLRESNIAQPLGPAVLRADFQVLYCSVIGLVARTPVRPVPRRSASARWRATSSQTFSAWTISR